MAKLKINNPLEFADDLKDAGTPFCLVSTTFTKTIIVNAEETYFYTSKGTLKNTELHLIKCVREYCESLNLKVRVSRQRINYIRVNNFKNGTYKNNIWEIDLNAAYWNLAYKFKFIDKGIYYRGLNMDGNGNPLKPLKNRFGNVYNYVSKMARLVALGNLAKSKTIFNFDGFKYDPPTKEHSDLTENYFFKVSQEVDSIMKMLSILAGEDYLFYWVDAIYVRSEAARDLICKYITNELGMNFKIVNIYKLLKTSAYIVVWDETNVNKDGDMLPRPYIFKSVPDRLLRQVLDIDGNTVRNDFNNEFIKPNVI